MKYKYVGEDCAFANYGDVFEKSKHGYTHNYNDDEWIGIPESLVEDDDDFEPINHEQILEDLVGALEAAIEVEGINSQRKKGFKFVIGWIKERI